MQGSFIYREATIPFLSVVIPTCNRNDLLHRALEALAPVVQKSSPKEYEVIVSDDGENSGAAEMIETQFPWAKWISGPRRGPAANRNHGAREARGEWLLFTDDDCIPDRDWLAAYKVATENNVSQSVFEGRVYADRARCSLAETAPLNERGGHLWSCNFMIRACHFNEIGGFDERFTSAAMEDVDLARRLAMQGHEPLFVPAAAVCHPWRRVKGWKGIREHGEATLTYLSLHPEESSHINSSFYLNWFVRSLVREIFVEGFRYRGAGLRMALLQSVGQIYMAVRLRNARSRQQD